MNSNNIPVVVVALLALVLLAVTGAASLVQTRNKIGDRISNGGMKRDLPGRPVKFVTLRRRGMQERGLCLGKGRCMHKVVTCPAECPERDPYHSQNKACLVDCSSACAASCNDPKHNAKASNADQHSYQAWCNKTNHESLCMSMVQSDPREKLKSNPQGLVVILVSAAKAKTNATSWFIEEALKNETTSSIDGYDTMTRDVLKGCLAAYSLDLVGSALSVDVHQVKDVQHCSHIDAALRDAVGEVTYDCEWDLPTPKPPVLTQMYENVEAFASIVDSARQILALIGCAGL